MDFQQKYLEYKTQIDRSLLECIQERHPSSLYRPLKYVLGGGGKRIRPILLILSCEAVGGKAEGAVHAGLGIEILHNFTLVHDDIMDHADSRRGRQTVHRKWDENVAILVGDELLALAYRFLLKTNSPRIQKISQVFTEGVVEVCEGQAYDKEYETRSNVTVSDYLLMIRKKTGIMVAASTEIGALIGNGNDEEVSALRGYGELVGRAFQVQDDLLDVIGDARKFGKKIGGDLEEGKKTYLLLEAMRRSGGQDRKFLLRSMRNGALSKKKLGEFQRIYRETGAIDAAAKQIREDIAQAKQELERLRQSDARSMLLWFTDMLYHRTY